MGKVGPFKESMFSCFFFYAAAQAWDGRVLFKNCTGRRQQRALPLLSFSDLFLPLLFVLSLLGVSTAHKYAEII